MLLTENPIHIDLKNQLLQLLQEAVKPYHNLILIPGSFLAYKKISEYKNKSDKIRKLDNNYAALFNNPKFREYDPFFSKEERQFRQIISSPELDNFLCLQNATYTLTSQMKLKHKKTATWYERLKLDYISPKSFFDIGVDDPKKDVIFANHKYKIATIICSEHHDNYYTNPLLDADHPIIQIIISNPTDINNNCLYGAINIHMDAISGLNIYINDSDTRMREIEDVVGTQYRVTENSSEVDIINIPSKHFNKIFSSSILEQWGQV